MTYPEWREAFASAMDPRLHNIEHLDRLVNAGHAQVWYGEKAAIVTEVRAYPTGALVIEGLVAAGEAAPAGHAEIDIHDPASLAAIVQSAKASGLISGPEPTRATITRQGVATGLGDGKSCGVPAGATIHKSRR